MSKLRNYCRLAANYYEDDVLLAAADECAAAMHLWPVLVAKAKAVSHKDDNPGGMIRTTVAKLSRDAYVPVDDVRAALDALAEGELLTCSVEGTNRLRITLTRFGYWQNPTQSEADNKMIQRANASREKASISPDAVQPASRNSPLEREGEREGERDKSANALSSPSVPKDDLHRRLFDHWLQATGRNPNQNRLTAGRRAQVNGRLRDGYTEEQLFAAIDGIAASDWHAGQNPGSQRYDTFQFIFRSGENIEKGLERSVGVANAAALAAAGGVDVEATRRFYLEQGFSVEELDRMLTEDGTAA